MSSSSERMAVNAAIERLVTRTDEDGEAARTVIAYGDKLRRAGPVQIRYRSDTQSSGDSISGYSPGHGEVHVEGKSREEGRDWEFGVRKDRIGHYRLWKQAEGRLIFHHFWKSDVTTKSLDDEGPDEYHLGYDRKSLEPGYLGVRREKVLISLPLGVTVQIVRQYLERIYGAARMPGLGFSLKLSL